MKSANVNTSEGIEVCSVDYEIPNILKTELKSAKIAFNIASVIKEVQIDGASVWNTVKCFNSTIDDDERKEIPYGDTFEFRSDVQRIKVYPSGEIYLKAYSKWQPEGYVEFEIELD